MRVIRLVGATCLALFAALMLASAVSQATGTRTATNVAGTEGNAQVSLTWTSPSLPPGTAPDTTGYELWGFVVEVVDPTTTPSTTLGKVTSCTANTLSSSQSCVITGYTKLNNTSDTLKNGTAYAFRVITEWFDQVNEVVIQSDPSDPTSSLTPYTKPNPPTGVAGAADATDPTKVVVTFTAPTDNGGRSVSNYTVTTYNSTGNTVISGTTLCGDSGSGATVSRSICSLLPNTAYTFKVTATNAGGTSTDSQLSAQAITIPGAPTLSNAVIDATGDTADITVTWAANSSNGAATITEYEVMPFVSDVAQTALKKTWTTGDTLTMKVNNLAISSSYTFKVRAKNATGFGPYSGASSPIVATKKPNTPSAPTGTDLNTGTSARVSWSLLSTSDANGSTITEYVVRAWNTSNTQVATCKSSTATSTSCDITGLTAGDYYFTVEATNGRGTSVKSANSATLTVAAVVSRNASQQIAKSGTLVTNVVGDGTRVDVGDKIDYTFTVTNNGNVGLNNVTVTDPLFTAAQISCRVQSPTNVIATLAANANTSCTATRTITQADIDAGVVTSTATVSATAADGGANPSNATSSTTTLLTQVAIVTLDKKGTLNAGSNAPRADAGDTISYSYVVTNTGNVTLTNLTVTDTAVASAGSDIVCRSNSPKNVIASLAPAASVECTTTAITYTITQADMDAGSKSASTNGSVSGSQITTVTNGETTTLTADAVVTLNKLGTINAGVNAPRPDAGDTITYSYVVTNTGNVTLTSLTVTDEAIGTPTSSIVCRGTSPQNVIASLNVGATATCTTTAITHTITQSDLDTGNVTKTQVGSVSGSQIVTKTDGETTVLDASPLATIVKTGTLNQGIVVIDGKVRVDANDTITYEYAVTNTGNVTLTNLDVIDDNISSATVNISCTGASVPNKNRIASLAPGAAAVKCTATYTITQADINTGQVSGTATLTGTAARGTLASATEGETTTLLEQPSVSIVKTSSVVKSDVLPDTRADAGDKVTYEIVIKNTGNVTLTSLTVLDPATASPSTDIRCRDTSPKNVITNLAPGVTATACTVTFKDTITQAQLDAGSVTSTLASVSGTAIRGTLTSQSDDIVTALDPVPVVSISKTGSVDAGVQGSVSDRIDVGDKVVYTFSITNDGNVTLTSLTVTDASITAANIVCPGGSPSNTITNLAPNATKVCTSTDEHLITQLEIDAGTVVGSSATVSGTAAQGTLSSATDSDVTTSLEATPSVTIDKVGTVGLGTNGVADATEQVTYTFVVRNTGNVRLSNVTVTDPAITSPGTNIDCGGTAPNKNVISSLDAGASETCSTTYKYTITQANLDAGTLTTATTASVSGTAPRGTPTTVTADAVDDTTLAAVPVVAIVKSSNLLDGGDSRADAGDKIEYSFTVTNTGNVTLSTLSVTDTAIGSPGSAIDCGGTAPNKNRITDLAPAGAVTCSTSYQDSITQAQLDAIAGSVTSSTATVSGSAARGVLSDGTDDVATTLTAVPVVTIEKKSNVIKGSNGRADAGDKIEYSFTVTNTGNVTLSTLSVTDTAIGSPGSAIDCGGSAPNKNRITDLAPAGAVTCSTSFTTTITQAQLDSGSVAGTTATVSGTPARGTLSNSTDDVTTTLQRAAEISMVQGYSTSFGSNSKPDIDETITFTYLVTNEGNVTLNSIFLADYFDDDTLIQCPKGDTNNNVIASLAPGSAVTCEITIKVTQAMINSGKISTFSNVSGSAPSGLSGVSDSDSVEVTLSKASTVSVTKTEKSLGYGSNTRPDVGDTVTYAYAVSNTGNMVLKNLTVTDTAVPVGTVIKCPADGTDNTIGTLNPGATVNCEVVVTLTKQMVNNGNITGKATVNGADTDSAAVQADSAVITTSFSRTASVTVSVTAVLNLAAVAPTTRLDAGDKITYSYVVTNTGNVTLSNLSVVDTVIASDTTAIVCPGNESAVNNKNVIATFEPGASAVTCTGTYTVVAADLIKLSIVDTATVSGASPAGTSLTQATASVTTAIPYLLPTSAGTRTAITKPALTIAQDAAVAYASATKRITVALQTPSTTSATAKVTKYVITFTATGAPVQTKTLLVTPNKTVTTYITGVKGKAYQIKVVATFGNKKTATWTGPKVTAG